MISSTPNYFVKALAWLLIWAGQSAAQIDPPLPASTSNASYLEQVSKQIGWGGERLAKAESANAPRFHLHGFQQDNAKRRVVLWELVEWANGGRKLPTLRQQIGDCVGFGAAQAVDHLQYVQVVLYAKNETPKRVFVPYHYACGRVAPECGANRIRGPDGSIGSWQAKALQLYGVIPADYPGLPAYSGQVARAWANKMPSPELVAEGRKHVVKTIALVTTPDQARDALCNGYPLTIASSWGGLMRPPVVDGKLVNRRATTWMHQMCILGFDGTGDEPLWYVLNSWGEDAHGTPPDGSPPGGFWIGVRDLLFILNQQDVWALSDLDEGFESRDLNVDGLSQLYQGGRRYASGPAQMSRGRFGDRGGRIAADRPVSRPDVGAGRTGHDWLPQRFRPSLN